MSKLCTSGTPALSIVASCRVKIAISAGLMALPLPPNNGLGFLRTLLGLMPCWRNCALAMAWLIAVISPLPGRPLLSVPLQVKMSVLIALAAMVVTVPLSL